MFYVRVATRSSGAVAQGSPRQALGYLADNHDRERDAGCSEEELNYIARPLEKEIAPHYTETSPSGAAVVKRFRWSAMDDRIFVHGLWR